MKSTMQWRQRRTDTPTKDCQVMPLPSFPTRRAAELEAGTTDVERVRVIH